MTLCHPATGGRPKPNALRRTSTSSGVGATNGVPGACRVRMSVVRLARYRDACAFQKNHPDPVVRAFMQLVLAGLARRAVHVALQPPETVDASVVMEAMMADTFSDAEPVKQAGNGVTSDNWLRRSALWSALSFPSTPSARQQCVKGCAEELLDPPREERFCLVEPCPT